HGAIGAGLAGAIGAAAVDIVALREFAAGLVAGRLELVGGGFRQREVAGGRRRSQRKRKAERKRAGGNDESGDGSHDTNSNGSRRPVETVAEKRGGGTSSGRHCRLAVAPAARSIGVGERSPAIGFEGQFAQRVA